jgi:hypothetical protein
VLRRLASSVLRWGLAGFLAATSLLGSQLHDIFGIHHAGQLSSCVGSGLALEHGPSLAAGHSESCDDEANCPICNYLAQGRIVGERFEAISVTVNVPNRSPAILLFLPSPHLQPFQARAPPAV